MGIMSEISNLLQQYNGASPSNPPANVERDFGQVVHQVPEAAVSSGLSDAFRSNQTPPFAQMLSQLFGQSNGEQRAGILNHLMSSLGPAAIPGGLSSLFAGRSSITPDQAQHIPPEAVQQLAENAEREDPSIIDRASQFYAQHPTLVQGLGAGALALVMSKISQHR
jgi:hypothetical protein